MEKVIENIKKYGNKNSCYIPFEGGVFYPLGSQDFVRTGFLRICPTLSARDYKDAKCVMVRNETNRQNCSVGELPQE